jgi:predicted regulator of Ras-like GTPase activity (Roadblock/LC7/MglB family)
VEWNGEGLVHKKAFEAGAILGEFMAKLDEILKNLEGLRAAIPELNGVLLASMEGLPIAHAFTNGEDPKRVAAMAAAAAGMGKRLTDSLHSGPLAEVCISGEGGQIFLYSIGTKAVLAVLGPNMINAGLIHLEARQSAGDIGKLF